MKIFSYTFRGAEEYDTKIFPVLESFFTDVLADPEGRYQIAVDEAILNALRYGKQGYDSEKVDVEIRLTESDITTVIISDSRLFDVSSFRANLRRLAANPQLANMRWGEYTAYLQRSRGYWLMLQFSEYVYLAASGKRVSLVSRIPFRVDYVLHDRIKDLVPRLFIESKDGVIS